MAMILLLAISLLLQGTLGELICEELPVGMCSFSISSTGKRCSLETGDKTGVFQCKTSEVVVQNMREQVETDECIKACGVDRNVVGISSDSLLDTKFTPKLCSKLCSNNCPNILELYSNLALAEGVFLPAMCKSVEAGVGPSRRAMSRIKSSGVASSPVSAIVAGPIPGSDAASDPAISPAGSEASLPDTSAPAPL